MNFALVSQKMTRSYHICPILHANVQVVLGRGVAFFETDFVLVETKHNYLKVQLSDTQEA